MDTSSSLAALRTNLMSFSLSAALPTVLASSTIEIVSRFGGADG